MPSLIDATKIQVAGFNDNSVWNDILFGESFNNDYIYTVPSGRTVGTIVGSTITIAGGDTSPFQVGNFVSFSYSYNLGNTSYVNAAYQVTAVGVQTITVATAPPSNIQNYIINVSQDLTNATYMLRVREFTATIQNANGIFVIGADFQEKPNTPQMNFDGNVVVVSAVNGWVRVNLPTTAFPDQPSDAGINNNYPSVYAGSLTVVYPAGTNPVTNPPQTKKQRVGWLIYPSLE